MGKPLPVVDSCVHPFFPGICAKLQEENYTEIQRSVEIFIQFNMISLWDWSCSPRFTKERKGGEKKPPSAFRKHDWLAVFNSNHSSVWKQTNLSEQAVQYVLLYLFFPLPEVVNYFSIKGWQLQIKPVSPSVIDVLLCYGGGLLGKMRLSVAF